MALLGPRFEQSNRSGTTVLVSAPKSVVLPPSTSAAVMDAELPVSAMVMFLQTAMGRPPVMVTVALQLEVLPEASATVSVVELDPMFEQSNKSGVTALETIAQLSVLPLSTSIAVMEAEVPVSGMVIFLHMAAGGVTSVTVTIALQEEELFDASVAVKVTLLDPRFEQSNIFGITVLETIAQLSLLPLSISVAVTEAEVVAKATVIL